MNDNPKHNRTARRTRMGKGYYDGFAFRGELAFKTTPPVRLRNGNGSRYDPNTEDAKHEEKKRAA